MKKLLCLLMAVALVFSFAACGGDGDSTDTGSKAPAGATKITFDDATYTVGVEEYIMFSEHVTVEPAGSKIVYSCSDTSIAELATPSRGEFMGIKTGTVTVTAASEDGKVTATCTLNVAGMGTVVAYDEESKVGGITNKRWGAVERPNDDNAFIAIIPKGLTGADMSNIVSMDAGDEIPEDSSHALAVNGYFVARTGDKGNYVLENVPEGEYIGIIISSMDYTRNKTYDKDAVLAAFKATAIASYFTDAQASEFVSNFYEHEFYVGELKVEANTTTIFGKDFQPDLDDVQ